MQSSSPPSRCLCLLQFSPEQPKHPALPPHLAYPLPAHPLHHLPSSSHTRSQCCIWKAFVSACSSLPSLPLSLLLLLHFTPLPHLLSAVPAADAPFLFRLGSVYWSVVHVYLLHAPYTVSLAALACGCMQCSAVQCWRQRFLLMNEKLNVFFNVFFFISLGESTWGSMILKLRLQFQRFCLGN